MNKNNLFVVLVEPQGSLNIGSVARAMLNFGFRNLRLVNPSADHLNREAYQMAVKAGTILESAELYPTLEEALSDCAVSMATTRRFGQYRERFKHPDEAAQQIVPVTGNDRAALVFGREDHGLRTEDLDLCQQLITIPTNDAQPSMNLAQSVMLCLYEVDKYRAQADGIKPAEQRLAVNHELEGMFQHMRQSLTHIGYLNEQNPDHILRTYRNILGRTQLNIREVNILRGLFNQIDLYSGMKLTRKQLAEDGDADV